MTDISKSLAESLEVSPKVAQLLQARTKLAIDRHGQRVQALASIDKGGYAQALARVAFLLAHRDEPLPLSRLQLAHEVLQDYRDLLPALAPDEARRVGGEQEIIARYDPERAIETLPALLPKRKDRERLLTLLNRVLADKRVQRIQPSAEQMEMLARIRGALGSPGRPGANGAQRRIGTKSQRRLAHRSGT